MAEQPGGAGPAAAAVRRRTMANPLPAAAAAGLRLAGWAMLWAGLLLPAGAEATPVYRLDVRLLPAAHEVRGEVSVTLPHDDARAFGPLWFHLPPNRFARVDPRGPRRHLESLPFGFAYVAPEVRDPWLPRGFSAGGIEVTGVRTDMGQALAFDLKPNPSLTKGYAVEDGLLRVDLPEGQPAPTVIVTFVIHLPNRLRDGWNALGLTLEEWVPVLANFGPGGWVLDVDDPRPGRYAARIASDAPGWIATGSGAVAAVAPGQALEIPLGDRPARSFPLVFLAAAEAESTAAGAVEVWSLRQPEGERVALLSEKVARDFLGFMEREYGLTLPLPRLVVIQADIPPEEFHTLGNLILVSRFQARDSALLDRIFLARLSRAVARVWFGQTVWANEDREAWLPLGLPGYFSLRFFESLYGWDGHIHDIANWLSPNYREHFFEAPVRGLIRDGEDAPLDISLSGYPRGRSALIALHQKAPLVMRSLAHVLGEEEFRRALGLFYRAFQYRTADHGDWQTAVQAESGNNLDWFFDEWFHGTPRIDYAIRDWEQTASGDGNHVRVTIARLGGGEMPLDVLFTDTAGGTLRRRIEGRLPEETLAVLLPAPVASIQLDPQEYVLEVDRRNNRTETVYRVRPIFDWAKQREVLVTLQGTAGGNAVDGNYVGLGGSVALDEDNHLRLMPIYGELTEWGNYSISWNRERFIHPRLSLTVEQEKLGGTLFQSVGLGYRYLLSDQVRMRSDFAVRSQAVDSLDVRSGAQVRSQSGGQANNASLGHEIGVLWNRYTTTNAAIGIEHSEPDYYSKFDYVRLDLRVSQSLAITSLQTVTLGMVRNVIAGRSPLQMQPLLGGPDTLRGYPRDFNLVHEQLAVARLDYRIVVSREVWGRTAQVREVAFVLFGDVGKTWDNSQTVADTPQRQDVGIGLELQVNVISLTQFPVNIEWAYPINDPQYTQPRLILLHALAF
jgi:hypothetical protein